MIALPGAQQTLRRWGLISLALPHLPLQTGPYCLVLVLKDFLGLGWPLAPSFGFATLAQQACHFVDPLSTQRKLGPLQSMSDAVPPQISTELAEPQHLGAI